ncbi:hypothetical protein QTP86_028593 [Hemibagrus guttatus]|nr:hypothetical protein QTP86_028593 [Hemibagrus guttatus]
MIAPCLTIISRSSAGSVIGESQEHHKALENLKQDSHTFMSRSQESDIFSAEEYKQSESTYNNATQYYNNLPQTVEQGEQNESVSNSYVTHIMRLRQRLERVGSHIIIRCCSQPVDTDPPKAFAQETTEQKNIQAVLEDIKKDLDKVVKQSEAALTCSQQSTWARILRSEIDITMKMLDHVDSLFSIYMDKVKSIDLGIHRTDGTGDVLRKFGNQLYYFHEVPANEKEVESNKAQLKT